MNVNRLLGKIKECRLTLSATAGLIGISVSAFRRKIDGESEFNLDEINHIADVLHLSNDELLNIFFDDKCHQ